MLAGVRLLIAEIVPAFKGISEELIPNSKPAIDCPIVFPYAPTAVLIGFLSSFIGGIVGLAMLNQGSLAVAPVSVLGNFDFANTTFSDADFTVVGIVFGNISKAFGGSVLFGLIALPFVAPIVYNCVAPKPVEKSSDFGGG